MPKDVYVTFQDGSSHVYRNAPDDVTPDAIEARAKQEFSKPVASLSRKGPVPAVAPAVGPPRGPAKAPGGMFDGLQNNLKGARAGFDRALGGLHRLEYITKGTGRGEHPERINVNDPLFIAEAFGNFKSPAEYRDWLVKKSARAKPLITGLEKADYGYKPQATWDKVKRDPLRNVLPFIGEQAVVSAPNMAIAALSPAGYLASLTGEMGQNRAENDGRTDADLGDMAVSAPSAAAQTALERFGLSRMLPGSGRAVSTFGQAAMQTGKAAGIEAGTEGLQTTLQSLAETAGTRTGFDAGRTLDDVGASMVAGAGIGGGMRGVTGAGELAGARIPRRAPMPPATPITLALPGPSPRPGPPRLSAPQASPAGGKVHRVQGVDHPVEVIGPPVMDAETGQMKARIRSETGAEGFAPADEIFDAPPANPADAAAPGAATPPPSGPPRMDAAGGSGGMPPPPPSSGAPAGPPGAGNGNPPRLTKAEANATRRILAMAKAAGVDPQSLPTTPDLLPVQVLGKSAEGVLKAAAQRPGTTAGLLDERVAQFDAAFPENFRTVTERSTGVDRDFIEGDIDGIIAKAQKAVKPQFDAFENLDPQITPMLEALLATPTGKQYLKGAQKNAKDMLQPAEDIQTYAQLVDGMPTDSGPTGTAEAYVPIAEEYLATMKNGVRPALKRARGPTVTEWLAETGGLADKDGDVTALDGHIAHKGVPFRRKLLNPNGRGLDDAAVAAWEQGYFSDHPTPPGPAELLELIRKDLAGQHSYARPASPAQEVAARVEDLERQLAHYGIDPTGKSAKQIAGELAEEEAIMASYEDLNANGSASVEPGVEVIEKGVPRPRVLYDVKKWADVDLLERDRRRNEEGKVLPDDFAKDWWGAQFRESLGGMVKGMGFDWDKLLREGGEAPKIRKAFHDGRRLVEETDVETLRVRTRDWGPLDKKAALGGFVKQVLDKGLGRQRFTLDTLKFYASDDFAARIAYLAGNVEQGRAWQAGMKRMLKQAEIRNLRGGSDTFAKQQGNSTLDEMEGRIDLRRIPKSQEGLINLALEQGNKVIDRVHSGFVAEDRNALGRLLLDREALQRALDALPEYEAENPSLIRRLTGPPRRGRSGPPGAGGGNPPRRGRGSPPRQP